MTKKMFPFYFALITAITALLIVTSGLVISTILKSFSNQIYQMEPIASKDFYLRIIDEALPGTKYYSNGKDLLQNMIDTVFGFTLYDPISLIKSEVTAFRGVEIRNKVALQVYSEKNSEIISTSSSSLPDEVPAAVMSKSRQGVLVYHTHSRESWIHSVDNPSSPFHEKENITLVGKRFAERLENMGIPVVYDATDHDGILLDQGIHRSKAYEVSAETVKQALKVHPNIQYIFDFHRDAVDRKYTTTTIDGIDYAKIMFVIGKHNENWEENYSFAQQLQNILDERYPGLARPIATYENDRSHNGKYNQKYSNYALTIEIGGMENTLQESLRTVEILAEIFAEVYFDAIPVFSAQEENL